MPLRLNDSDYQKKDERVAMTLLATAVHHWLSYVDKVSRTNLLLESSLRYAISEFVERKMHETCLLEQKHPHFVSRPIDFMWPMEDLNFQVDGNVLKVICEDGTQCDAKEKILESGYVLECKYAGAATNGSHERQRIFNDLCRLYYVIEHYPNVHAMFMMAGDITDFKDYFQDSKPIQKKNKKKIEENAKQVKMSDINVAQNDFSISSYKNIDSSGNKLPLKLKKKTQSNEYIESSYNDWFGFDIVQDNQRTIDTNFDSNNVFYKEFISQYSTKAKKHPQCYARIKIKTELLALCPQSDRHDTQVVAVWKISKAE